MNTNIAKLSALVALFVAGSASAYQITLENNTKRQLQLYADFAGTSGAEASAKIDPYDSATISSSWKLDCMNFLAIRSYGTYENFDYQGRKASNFNPLKDSGGSEDIYTWNGLICGDQRISVRETNTGVDVNW